MGLPGVTGFAEGCVLKCPNMALESHSSFGLWASEWPALELVTRILNKHVLQLIPLSGVQGGRAFRLAWATLAAVIKDLFCLASRRERLIFSC